MPRGILEVDMIKDNKTIYIFIASNFSCTVFRVMANIRNRIVIEYVFTYINSDSDLQRNQ